MPRCRARFSSSSARPVRAAEPRRSILSEEGGVGTVSSSVRRARSSRGDRRGLGRRFGAVFRAVCFAVCLIDRFAEGRAAFLRSRAGGFPRRVAFRLAMVTSFRNLDSFAISVVLSVAYRDFDNPLGVPVPQNEPPANRPEVKDRPEETCKAWRSLKMRTLLVPVAAPPRRRPNDRNARSARTAAR